MLAHNHCVALRDSRVAEVATEIQWQLEVY